VLLPRLVRPSLKCAQSRFARRSDGSSHSSDSSAQFYDYDDVSDADSWRQSQRSLALQKQKNKNKNNQENIPPHPPTPHSHSLNLSGLHTNEMDYGEIDWGDKIKVDGSSNPRPASASTSGSKKVRVPGGRQIPFCNKTKFDKMAAKDTTADWYVFNDGSKYVNSSTRQMREDNMHRNRGQIHANEKGKEKITTNEPQFHNVVGKRSAMPLPLKSGVVCGGKYFGKVECSSQIDGVRGGMDKTKWLDKKGWMAVGDRQKVAKSERKAGYWKQPYN